MKNKNGFISISVVYSFFMVFLVLLLFIVNNLVSNRTLINSIKDEIKDEISDTTFSRYLINHASELGLVHHNSSLTGGAEDNSYRYVGSNPNNYILFNDEMYRIIGVINDRVKVIKDSSVTTMAISTSDTNYYVNTEIYSYLNSTFPNSLGTNIDLLATSTYYIGGITNNSTTDTIKTVYDNEVGEDRNNNTRINTQVSLLYASDYAYATDTSNYNGHITGSNNWLNNGTNYWTASRVNTSNNQFFYISSSGNLAIGNVAETYQIRPVFSLVSTVRFVGGTGSSTDPYRIEG